MRYESLLPSFHYSNFEWICPCLALFVCSTFSLRYGTTFRLPQPIGNLFSRSRSLLGGANIMGTMEPYLYPSRWKIELRWHKVTVCKMRRSNDTKCRNPASRRCSRTTTFLVGVVTALLDHRGARPRRRIRRTLGTLSATSVGHDVVPPSGRRRGGEVSCAVSSNKRCDSSESPSGIRDIGGTAGHQLQLLLVLHPKNKESVIIYSGVGQRQASHQLRQVLVSQQETTAEKTRRVYAAVTTRSLAERLVYQHFAPFSSCWLRFFGGRFRNFGVVLSGGQSSPKAAANEDEPTRFELIRCSIAGVKKGWVGRGECKAQKRDGGGCNDLATPRVKLQRLNSALIITLRDLQLDHHHLVLFSTRQH